MVGTSLRAFAHSTMLEERRRNDAPQFLTRCQPSVIAKERSDCSHRGEGASRTDAS